MSTTRQATATAAAATATALGPLKQIDARFASEKAK